MKRIVFALALVALGTACKKADQSGQMAADTTQGMAADSTMMAGDTTHMMMAPDSAKKN